MSQDTERYAHATLGRTIKALVEALEGAAGHIRELGCTCVDGGSRHGKVSCQGDQIAREYEAIARRVRRRAGVQEPAPKGTR